MGKIKINITDFFYWQPLQPPTPEGLRGSFEDGDLQCHYCIEEKALSF